jgi:hypothetical protein
LASFETIVQGLTKHRITEEEAIRNDFYLRALALFGSGVFYHRWAGALGAEARFALTLTAKGKKRRKEDIAAFPGYQRDSESISRDPLGIEQILERKLAKPFPKAFWRLFSVDTVFGQWIPEPIARLVDKRLSQDVMPYVRAIASGTKAPRLTKISAELRRETHKYNRENLIMQDPSIVTVWRNRIERLRSNKELIRLRVFPYTRVPDLLSAEARKDIIKAAQLLTMQLKHKRKRMQAKKIVSQFLCGDMTFDGLYDEWEYLRQLAVKML